MINGAEIHKDRMSVVVIHKANNQLFNTYHIK